MAVKSTKPRVIVAGGGPVGLYTAHALAKANIDYVVLEQNPEIIRLRGAGIVLLPNTMRLLDQLGLCKPVEELGTEINSKVNSMQDGRLLTQFRLFEPLQEAFAYPTYGFSRRDLIRILYEALPERESRIKTKARIVDIETHDSGVRVRLEDGSIEEGSLIIGVDGVHSKTREIMRKLIRESSGSKGEEDAYPMLASYKGVFGRAPCRPDVTKGTFYESHGTGLGSQVINGKEFLYYAFFIQLPTPTTARRRFTRQDLEEEVKKLSDVHLFPTVKFKDIWSTCDPENDAALVHIEEGFVEKWHHGRIVLLGDAVHKMTPVNGNGLNTGLQSAAVLVNQLHGILSSGSDFTNEALEKAFSTYQATQEESCRKTCDEGQMLTRLITWTTWTGWFFDRFIVPWMNLEEAAKKQIQPKLADAHVLDFVPFESRVGEIPWNRMPKGQA
ncbi:putative dehydrogenase [Hypoxylon sp. FL1150]|nr:putative dehydrogenase [Hypoxylon sp. FL1150]